VISPSDILNASILVVDDQECNILLLERMLSGAGYRSVMSTTRPMDVYDLHRKNHYALILLDLEMPEMDGFQVMERLKLIEKDGYLPVLVLTAQPGLKLRALKAGAKDFVSKPFDIAEVLMRVNNMLEVRLLHIETNRLYEQVMSGKKISERLLLNVLPSAIADRLKDRLAVATDGFTEMIVDSYSAVSVLFADIVGFTKFSERVSADVLVHVLNDIFTRFDTIADCRGLEKIKTVGDAYMAVAGLPAPVADHAIRAADMALDMLESMGQFNEQSGYALKIRIGVSTGPAVAGIIGKRKFLYDLWGDVVNTASRMESHGLPGRIQISGSTQQMLNDLFVIENRGRIIVKDMGVIDTWFLNDRTKKYNDERTYGKIEQMIA